MVAPHHSTYRLRFHVGRKFLRKGLLCRRFARLRRAGTEDIRTSRDSLKIIKDEVLPVLSGHTGRAEQAVADRLCWKVVSEEVINIESNIVDLHIILICSFGKDCQHLEGSQREGTCPAAKDSSEKTAAGYHSLQCCRHCHRSKCR